MAPISIGQLVHTYPVGTWNSSESASKCFATHKNGTHLHWSLVHTYLVGTWKSSESAQCFATHNGTHLHWYTPTLWVHGTAQSLPQSALQLTRMAPISIGQLCSGSARDVGSLVGTGTHLPCGDMEQLRVCPQSALQLTRMAPIFTGQLVHTYPVGTWNSSECAPKCFATHKNGTHLHWSISCGHTPSVPTAVTLGPWLAQVHTYPVGTWNSSESAQSALQLTRMAPISIDVGSLVGTGTHLPCGYMEQLRVCPKVLCNSQEWHPSPLVSLNTPTLSVHGTAQSLPQSALQLTRMAPISIGQLVHTYPVGTWNSSESAPKCFATHKNGTHLHWNTPTLSVHGTAQSLPQSALQLTRMAPISIGQLVHTYPVGTWNSSESAPKCFATHKNGTHLHWSACTHLPCGYMEQLRVCPKVLCNSQEWHPSPLVSLYTPTLSVHGTTQSLPQSALQLTRMAPISIGQLVHTYPVGTWNSSESAPKCFATHKNGTHLHWSACTHRPCGYMEQLRVCPKVLCNSQMAPISIGQLVVLLVVSHPQCSGSALTLGPWMAQVHTYPVGTWNSSGLPQCFATHKMAPISIGQLVVLIVVVTPPVFQSARDVGSLVGAGTHLPCGYMEQLRSAPKCFATHKNGTHLHWYTPTLWVHGTSQVCPKCLQLSGTHLHWYTPTLWVHGTAQSVPQSALQLTEWHPSRLVSLYTPTLWVYGTAQSLPHAATHKNGTHLDWSACTPYPVGTWTAQSLPQVCNHKNGPISIGQYTPTLWVHGTAHLALAISLVTDRPQLRSASAMAPISLVSFRYIVVPQCSTWVLGTGTTTLWVHGTAQSVPQSALQLTRMAPIPLVSLYTPTLWVHGTAQSVPQSALQLTRMAPISTDQFENYLLVVVTPQCSGSALTLGPWLAQVHNYPVGTWNSSECASKCFATHKNGTHLN
ncbi:hypothetical protein EMCRGX_G003836 [Ephydatia muelleri]